MSDQPKSAYEIAMEKLRRQDQERGEAGPAALTAEQKDAIAKIRRVWDAKMAEREILARDERRRIQEEPEGAEKLQKYEEDYARERRRMEEKRDAEIAAVRTGRPASGGSGGDAGPGGGKGSGGRGGGAGGRGRRRAGAAVFAGWMALAAAPADAAPAAAGPGAAEAATEGAGRLLVIQAARLFDPVAGRTIRNAVVVVEDGRIRSAGPAEGHPDIPATEVIDLGDATLLPGLIDTHTHLLLQGDPTRGSYEEQVLNESIPHRTVRAAAAARAALHNGFTTLRDLGTEGAGYADVALRDGIAEGYVPGPRLLVATLAIGIGGAYPPSGFPPATALPGGVQAADGPWAGRAAVREQVKYGADWIKVYCDRAYSVDAAGRLDSIPTFEPDELRAIVDEAHRQGRKVAAHAMAPRGIARALDAGVDSIEHGVGLDAATAARMKAQNVAWVPTLTVVQEVAPARAEEGGAIWARMPEFHRRAFETALRAGVRIAFGTDAGGFPWTVNQAVEFSRMVGYGMTPAQALRSATVTAAGLLGLDGSIGRIAPGYRADLVAVPGDPLLEIGVMERVGFVMTDGVVRRNDLRR
jgi:imidazolonepropionase-like amidohydrolase